MAGAALNKLEIHILIVFLIIVSRSTYFLSLVMQKLVKLEELARSKLVYWCNL